MSKQPLELDTINRLYLELSQIATAKTERELELERQLAVERKMLADFTQRVEALESKAPYGYCPVCNAPGVERERRPNGNDRCRNGHVYPSAASITRSGGSR